MRSSTKKLISSLLLVTAIAGVGASAICGVVSYYVDKQLTQKMIERAPFDQQALEAYAHFRKQPESIGVMKALADQQNPMATIVLMKAYGDLRDSQAQRQLLMSGLGYLEDPDLLLMLDYSGSLLEEGEFTAQEKLTINTCFDALNKRYTGPFSGIRARYALLEHRKTCASLMIPERDQGL